MKTLTCEMCGSIDLVKQDGLFVCQNCGVKYSVEEAKKLMGAESAAETKEERIARLRKQAAEAKKGGDIENLRRYYKMILEECPEDWEADFYSTFFEASSWRGNRIRDAVEKLKSNTERGAIETAFVRIRETISDPDEQRSAYKEVASAIMKWANELVREIAADIQNDPEHIYTYVDSWMLPVIYTVGSMSEMMEYTVFDDCDMALKVVSEAAKVASVLAEATSGNRLINQRVKNRIKIYESDIKSLNEKKAKKATAERGARLKQEEEERKVQLKKQQEEQQARNDAYWQEHAEDKARLEAERKTLEAEISSLRTNENTPAEAERAALYDRMSEMRSRKESLGMFRGKEKRELQEQLDAATAELKTLNDKVAEEKAEIRRSIEVRQTRLSQINAELIKDR